MLASERDDHAGAVAVHDVWRILRLKWLASLAAIAVDCVLKSRRKHVMQMFAPDKFAISKHELTSVPMTIALSVESAPADITPKVSWGTKPCAPRLNTLVALSQRSDA